MNTLLVGINHNTASIAIREKVVFAPEIVPDALHQLVALPGVMEGVIVSTCNRTELYCVLEEQSTVRNASESIADWLCRYHVVDRFELQQALYIHSGNEMVRHLMVVSSGLDSMVLGEPQILGQIKSAYAVARDTGVVGTSLMRLFDEVFAVAKQVRTDTAIGQSPVSVAFAAVSLAQKIFEDLGAASALLIGAGKTIELVIQHLQELGVKSMVVANRTQQNALALKEKYGVNVVLLSDIPAELVRADIVVSSTASQLPILGKGAVERALRERRHRPMFMVDLAVPRDIEPEVGELDDIYLYSVDDLREVIDSSLESRQTAAMEARQIIERSVEGWEQKLRTLSVVDTLRSFRQKAEAIRDAELDRALKSLDKGDDARRIMENLARLLTNKLIHSPSVQLKQAAADGHMELIDLASRLFELENGKDTVAAPSSQHDDEGRS